MLVSGKNYNRKKKNRSHPIPKEQQIKQTSDNQVLMMTAYLNGMALKTIHHATIRNHKGSQEQTPLPTPWKEEVVDDINAHEPNGRAIERKCWRLWVGKVKRRGRYDLELPKFDRLPDRTGRPLTQREIKCFKIGIKYNRDIYMLSRLSGRSVEEVKKIIKNKLPNLLKGIKC